MEGNYYSIENTLEIKEKLFNLNLRNAEDFEVYVGIVSNCIKSFAGLTLSRTYDKNGNVIVGWGFNMNRPEAITEWNDAFPNPDTRPDFHAIKSGKSWLNKVQADTLFRYGVEMRRGELRVIYGEVWDIINPSIKTVIESLYYHGGNVFVGKQTNFYKYLMLYYGITKDNLRVEPGNYGHLKRFKMEVGERSNKYKDAHIQEIRESQALLLDITTCSGFSVGKFIEMVNKFWNQEHSESPINSNIQMSSGAATNYELHLTLSIQ